MTTATLSILVSNHFGVLTKVTGLFGRRGYNISALSVGETEDPRISRITIQTRGDEQKLAQIISQVSKLEEVFAAERLTKDDLVERELVLIKVHPNSRCAAELMELATEFSAKSTAAEGCVIIEASGETARMNQLIERIKPMGIIELSRTGATALSRHGEPLSSDTEIHQYAVGGFLK